MKPEDLKPEDRDELRRLAPPRVLWGFVAAAKEKFNAVVWRAMGGPETEDFLHALETGGQHPLLQQWERLKATATANRPAPGLLEQNTRRYAVLMVESLVRAGLGKDAARRRAAEAVERLFPTTTKRTIKHWQRNYSISAEDEGQIVKAIERHGHDHDGLVDHFAALIRWADNPVTAWTIVRSIPPDGQ